MLGRFSLRDDRTLFLFVFAADLDAMACNTRPAGAEIDTARKVWQREVGILAESSGEMDLTQELYFDRVSQIKMETLVERPCLSLVGDARILRVI